MEHPVVSIRIHDALEGSGASAPTYYELLDLRSDGMFLDTFWAAG